MKITSKKLQKTLKNNIYIQNADFTQPIKTESGYEKLEILFF